MVFIQDSVVLGHGDQQLCLLSAVSCIEIHLFIWAAQLDMMRDFQFLKSLDVLLRACLKTALFLSIPGNTSLCRHRVILAGEGDGVISTVHHFQFLHCSCFGLGVFNICLLHIRIKGPRIVFSDILRLGRASSIEMLKLVLRQMHNLCSTSSSSRFFPLSSDQRIVAHLICPSHSLLFSTCLGMGPQKTCPVS